MSAETTVAVASAAPPLPRKSVLVKMANAYDMEPNTFLATIKATVMPNGGQGVSNEQVAAFLSVAQQYGLNPFTREIYAFPAKGGGIQQIVSIDGWLKLINNHPQFDGMEFVDVNDDNGRLVSVTCKIFRRDRGRSIESTEYLSECSRGTDPWKQWPRRMLRHKAAIQAARYAFSFSGIVDPDEAERAFDIPQVATAHVIPEGLIVTEGLTRTEKLIAAAKAKQAPPIDVKPLSTGSERDFCEATHPYAEPAQEEAPATPEPLPAESVEAVEAALEDLSDPSKWNV